MSDHIYFDGQRYISAAEASERVDLTRDYVARLCRDGRVAGKRVGKNWYVEEESLQDFITQQSKVKHERRAHLAAERAQEYALAHAHAPIPAAMPVVAHPPAGETATHERSPILVDHAVRVHRQLKEKATIQGARALSYAPAALAQPVGLHEAVTRTIAHGTLHVPAHAISPVTEFIHKFVALTLAFTMTFGTYALVDPTYAKFAYESAADTARSIAHAYERTTGGGITELASASRERLMFAAENPKVALAQASSASLGFIPETLRSLARTINSEVDAFVYAIAFPDAATRSLANTPDGASVVINVAPYVSASRTASERSAVATDTAGAAPQNPVTVIERRIETERIVAAAGGISEEYLNARLTKLEQDLRGSLIASPGGGSSGYTTINNNYQLIAQSNNIDRLGAVTIEDSTITGGTISGSEISDVTITGSSFAGSVSATTLSASGTSTLATTTVSGDLTVSGNTTVSGTLTIPGAISISSSTIGLLTNTYATTSFISAVTASTTNLTWENATGTNATTTNLFTAQLTAAALTIGNLSATSTTATSTFAGGALFTRAPTLAHTFGTWATGAADSAWHNATLVVNPASAVADSNLISASVNGSPRFIVDAEGDVFVNNLTSVGSVTLSTTSASTFTVEGNTTLGDAITDVTTVNGALIVTGTTTASTVQGNFGVGTSTPWGRISISAVDNGSIPQLVVASSSAISLIVDNRGYVGIGTSSPAAKLSVDAPIYVGGTGVTATSTIEGNLHVWGLLKVGTSSSYISESNISTIGDLTATNATTTSFYSTTASSTNLYASNAQFGALTILGTLSSTGLATFQNGFISQASSTVAGAFTATGNANIGGTLGVGVSSQNASAALQIDSTTQGFLPPRMTTAQKNAIGSAAAGLTVFDTSLNKLNVYNGTSWKNVGSTEIGGEVTSGSLGSVLFIGDGTVLGQDSTNFTFSTSTNRLFVSQASSTRLSVFGTAYFGGTSTSSFSSTGALTLVNQLTLSGSAANIALGSNYLSGDGDDEGIYVNGDGNVGVGQDPGSSWRFYVNDSSRASYFAGGIRIGADTGYVGLEFADLGTAATPVLRQFNGADAGLFFPSEDSLAVSTNNTERMRVTGTGNVGIGTTSPWKMLSVAGDIIGTNVTATGTLAVASLTSGRVPFASTGGELTDSSAFTFDSALARLSATYASTTALTVSGQLYTSGSSDVPLSGAQIVGMGGWWGIRGDSSARFNIDTYHNGSNQAVFTIDQLGNTSIGTSTSAAQLTVWGDSQSSTLLNLVDNSSTTVMTVKAAGNVGIGTASPTNGKLQITGGNAPSQLTITTSDWVSGSIGSVLYVGSGASTGNTYFGISAQSNGGGAWNNLVLQSGGGSVGIGNVSPWATLAVTGGLGVTASSTVGDGTQAGGLTISGGATTTGNAILQGTLTVSGNTTLAAATSSAFAITGLTSAVVTANANGSLVAASTQTCTNQFIRSLSAAYVATCASVTSADITNDTIVNADINSAAGIAYSKLNLSGSIVNADISGSAAIAYSKLNLASSIVNADINNSAAIAYSKLNLTSSITASDLNLSDITLADFTNDANYAKTTVANSWTALQSFSSGASTTAFSIFNNAYFGATATSSFSSTGALTLANRLTLSGSTANIALGSNYLSGDGDDEGVYVSSDGKVGIGTTSPYAALSIQGPISLFDDAPYALAVHGGDTSSGISGGGILLRSGLGISASTRGSLEITGGDIFGRGSSVYLSTGLGSGGAGNVLLGVDSSGATRGSVGIGTTSPWKMLSVAGDIIGTNITATGTLAVAGAITSTASTANTFPYASTTALSATTGYFGTASTSALTISGGATTTGAQYVAGGLTVNSSSNSSFLGTGDVYLGSGTLVQGLGGAPDLSVEGYINTNAGINTAGDVRIGGSSASLWTSLGGSADLAVAGWVNANSGLQTAQGSASSPSLLFYSTNNTGIFATDSNANAGIGFSTQGSERARIDNAGYFGIGSSTPWAKLSVTGTAGHTRPIFQVASSTNNPFFTVTALGNLLAAASSYLNFGTMEGTSGYGFRDNSGTLQFKHSGGSWADIGSGAGVTGTAGQIAYLSATDTLSATSSIFLSNKGNFGVGSSTPWAKLSIHAYNGETNTTLFAIASSTANSTTTIFSISNTGVFNFGKTSTSTIVDNTPYAWTIATSSTASPLINIDTTAGAEVVNIGHTSSDVIIGGVGFGSDLVFEENSTIRGQGSGRTITLGANSDVLAFGTADLQSCDVLYTDSSGTISCGATDAALWTSSGSNIYRSSGSVGIGTTTPYYSLTIASSTGPQLALSDGTNNAWAFRNVGGNFYLATSTYSATSTVVALSINTSGTVLLANTLTAVSSGNVGIGNASPSYKLDVTGFVNVDGTAGGYKIAGANVLYASTTNNSVVVGPNSGASVFTAASATHNVVIGSASMTGASVSGDRNNVLGASALVALTSGSKNQAIGVGSLTSLTEGWDNIAIGDDAGYYNATGNANVYIGQSSGRGTSGQNQSSNVAVGYRSLYTVSTGGSNTVLGNQAGYTITSGSNNVIIGNSGTSGGITSGSNNILIGQDVRDGLSVTSSNQLNIGNLLFGTGLGSGTTAATGNFGIGTSSPLRKLAVAQAASAAQFAVAYDSGRVTEFQTDSSGDIVIDPSGNDVRINDDNLWVCASGSCPSGTPSANGTLVVETAIGVGTSTPLWPFTGSSASAPQLALTDGTAASNAWTFRSAGNTLYVATSTAAATSTVPAMTITPNGFVGIGTTSPSQQLSTAGMLFVGANGATGMGTATSTFYGDIKIVGKLDVSTIDPVYHIDGIKYATYGHSTIGIKEETMQVISLAGGQGGTYSYTIDFDEVKEGSDLWLFYQITDFGKEWQNLVVTLTPSFSGAVHYEKSVAENTLTIYGDRAGEVSMRLVGNRYDFSKWPNLREDQDGDTAGTHIISSKGK